MGAKETGGQLSLRDCGFSLDAIFDPFFWQQKGPKWRGSRIISLISKIGIQNPPKTSCQRSNPTKLIPRGPPGKKQNQTPFWGSKILRKGSLLVLERYIYTGWWFGLEHFLFFHTWGIIIPTDFHIFQRGWNHQPVVHICLSRKATQEATFPAMAGLPVARSSLRPLRLTYQRDGAFQKSLGMAMENR